MMRLFSLFLLFMAYQTAAQQFAVDIRAFQVQDSIEPPPQNAILFIGSSSFTMWEDVQNYFPENLILNRGFGGSSLTDLIRYEAEIIFPYRPKQIVIYCGENDLAGDTMLNGLAVFGRFYTLFEDIRAVFPDISIGFISMKPSPSRMHLFEKMQDGNARIKHYLDTQKNTFYADVFHQMLKPDGAPNEQIFLEDMLHMNAKGYAIWKKVLEPYLLP